MPPKSKQAATVPVALAKARLLALFSSVARADVDELLEFCTDLSDYLHPVPLRDPNHDDSHNDHDDHDHHDHHEHHEHLDHLHLVEPPIPTLVQLDQWSDARANFALYAATVKDRLASPGALLDDEKFADMETTDITAADTATDASSSSPKQTRRPPIHVDGFLYHDEDDIDEMLVQEKQVRHYCTQCGSDDIELTDFITHSMTRTALEYIFLHHFSGSKDSFLDIGCRTGAVLFAAATYTASQTIRGIDLSASWCQLAHTCLDAMDPSLMTDAITVTAGDVGDHLDQVRSSQVTVLNNPFEYFLGNDGLPQRALWTKLADAWCAPTASCHTLITVPSLADQWKACGWGSAPEEAAARAKFERQWKVTERVFSDDYDLFFYSRSSHTKSASSKASKK
ncbi:hypothetical protein BC828DRAFT_386380 [Blastocladiella britannica]|nr:hypothetical protein BC828DRAFT_386380 [Blastocladiella britannica]